MRTCQAAFIVRMCQVASGNAGVRPIPDPLSEHLSSSGGGKMLKKLNNVFALSLVFSLAGCVFLLSFSSTSKLSYLSPNRKDGLLDALQQQVGNFWKERTEEQRSPQTTTGRAVTPVATTLGPCPETPPVLVGPLRVEFDFNRTWHDVRKEITHSLQKGGRYKPPDCISNHKVGNFNKRVKLQKKLF